MAEDKNITDKRFTIAMVEQMLTLATAGFGLAAGLAWNSLIQAGIDIYIKPWLPSGVKLLSQAVYAIIVTVIAVIVTYNLTKFLKKLQAIEDRKQARKSENLTKAKTKKTATPSK